MGCAEEVEGILGTDAGPKKGRLKSLAANVEDRGGASVWVVGVHHAGWHPGASGIAHGPRSRLLGAAGHDVVGGLLDQPLAGCQAFERLPEFRLLRLLDAVAEQGSEPLGPAVHP